MVIRKSGEDTVQKNSAIFYTSEAAVGTISFLYPL
jgi:hypothetical protein